MNPSNFGMSNTEITLIALFAILIIWILYSAMIATLRGGRRKFVEAAPTLMTSLGILGTFVGIVVGLFAFDPARIDDSIRDLLSGLRTAFVTSVFGMGATIFFKWWDSSRKINIDSTVAPEQIGPRDIYTQLRKQNESMSLLVQAVGGSEENSMVGQLKLLRTDVNDFRSHTQRGQQSFEERLWRELQTFAEMLSKSATEQVIEALRQVIIDFNKNLTEQFGDNFRRLDDSVKKLVDWQAEYKEQMKQMIELFDNGVQAIDATRGAVVEIKEQTGRIPADMQALAGVINTNQHQIQELGRHLEAFMALRQQAIQAVPDIQKKLEEIGEKLNDGAQAMQSTLNKGAAEFKDNVTGTNQSLAKMAAEVANQSDNISKELTDSLEKLVQNNERIKSGVSDAVAAAMESVQTNVGRSLGGVEKQIQDAVMRTGEGVNTQLRAVDEALGKQLNQALSELGSALATIAGRLLDSYERQSIEVKQVLGSRV